MRRVCCVCQGFLEEVEPLEDKTITHTYCPSCLKKTRQEWARIFKKEKDFKNAAEPRQDN